MDTLQDQVQKEEQRLRLEADLAASIDRLASLYACLRFGRDATHHDIVTFERDVRKLAV